MKKRRNLLLMTIALLMEVCNAETPLTVTVKNPLDMDRNGELVEIHKENIPERFWGEKRHMLVIWNSEKKQIPYQQTHDGNLIFPAEVKANSKSTYTITYGIPIETNTSVYGRKYPERLDDVAWENDYTAYRTYGPALQASGERAFGYDIWLKNVPELVVEERYRKELNPDTRARIKELRKNGKHREADELYQSTSYHIDHGNGLDCYKVGPTLGSGTSALLDNDSIVYPYCYVGEPEILENGPLRFTMKLRYAPLIVGTDSAVVETRIISLDKGSRLNRTTVSYEGLSIATPLAVGIVIHPENPDGYTLNAKDGYITYTDLTDNINNGNGEIYIGVAFLEQMKDAEARFFSEEERQTLRGGACGHAMAMTDYIPGMAFSYYWGNGWNKYGIANTDAWQKYMQEFVRKIRNPLQVTIQ